MNEYEHGCNDNYQIETKVLGESRCSQSPFIWCWKHVHFPRCYLLFSMEKAQNPCQAYMPSHHRAYLKVLHVYMKQLS